MRYQTQCTITSFCSTDSERPHRCCHIQNRVEITDRMPDIPNTLQWDGICTPKLPIPLGDLGPNQEQTRVGPKNNNTVLRAHILRMRCAAKFSFRSVAQPHRSVHFQIIQSFGSPQFQDSDPPD